MKRERTGEYYQTMFKIGLLAAVILTLAAGFVLLRVYRQRMEVPTGAVISLVLDFFCMLVGIVLYVSSKQYLKTDIKSTAVLMNMVFATICAQFLAVFIWVFEGPEGSPLLNYTVNLLYFCVAEVVLMCYLRYQWEILGRQAFGSQWLYRASVWFGVAILAIYALNPLGGFIFFIDADGFYRRGAYYWVSLVYPAYVFLLSVYLALRCNQPRSVRMNLLFYWAAPLIGVVTQTVRIGVLLVYPGVLLSEIILIVNLHAEVMQRYLRQRAELTDNQSKIMLSQIQPHFLYNALASISHLCRKEGAWEAKDAVDHFSDYLRSNMESIRQERLVRFEKELEHVKNYLWLEQMRFGDDLKVEYRIEAADFLLPPLTVQPLVENAVKHGICGREGGGSVWVESRTDGGTVEILIRDDGVGFDADERENDGKIHVGIENVRSRLELLCGGRLDVESVPGEGTCARITLPAAQTEREQTRREQAT